MRAVREDMPEVAAAARAQHRWAHHAVARVGLLLHRVLAGRGGEGRPAAAGVVLRVGVEQLRTAAGAPVRPGLEDVVVLSAERRLGPLVAEDPILLGGQLLAPLLLGLLDLCHDINLVGLGAPTGIRTRATALKGPRPGPLVDGGQDGPQATGRRDDDVTSTPSLLTSPANRLCRQRVDLAVLVDRDHYR